MLKVSVRKWYRREKDKVSSGAKKRNEMQVYTFYYCLLCIVYPGGVRQLTNELQLPRKHKKQENKLCRAVQKYRALWL